MRLEAVGFTLNTQDEPLGREGEFLAKYNTNLQNLINTVGITRSLKTETSSSAHKQHDAAGDLSVFFSSASHSIGVL